MRRPFGILALLFVFVLGFVGSLWAEDLLGELQKLRNLKRSKHISTDQFFLLFDNLLEKYSGTPSHEPTPYPRRQPRPVLIPPAPDSPEPPERPESPNQETDLEEDEENALPVDPSVKTFLVDMRIYVTRYWRAKNLVELITAIEFTCDGKGVSGRVMKNTPDDIRFKLPLRLTPGMHQFEVVYTARMRKASGDSASAWEQKTYRFPFGVDIQKDGKVTKVVEFIEKRGLWDSKAEAKIMDITVYKQLLANRKKNEQEAGETPSPESVDEE